MTEPTDPTELEVTIAAPPDEVWQALRDPELIRRWHGWHFEEHGGLDEEIRIIYVTGAAENPQARVLELSDGDRFTLDATEHGTVVRITRAPRGMNPDWDAYYDDVTEGWWMFLTQLRFALERHGLAERQTVMLEGALPDGGSLVDLLGLSSVADLAPGTPYRAPVATGEELQGYVWARSPRQLALTVDSAGDGLLVLAQQPVTEHRPAGGALLVLTTYGFDPAAFAEVQARWSRWWASVQPAPAGTGTEESARP